MMPCVVMLGPLPPLVGGMASVVANLCNCALSRYCHLTVINNGKTTPEERPFLTGVKAQIRLLYQLIKTIIKQRAKIVHIHTCSGFTFWRDCIHALLARLFGSRVILHIHGGGFIEFVDSQHYIGKLVIRLALSWVSRVIVLSSSWVSRLKPFAPQAKWCIVPNGVPLPPCTASIDHLQPTFLFLGNLGERKGAVDLVRAAQIAIQKGFNGQILLAGKETAPGQSNTLERLINELNLQSHVRLIGVISGEAKVNVIKSADCFILPSHAEGLPMAMLEAMSYGLPVISTKVGSIPEVITDGVEGYLIEPGDIESLADRIFRLGQDVALRKRMGRAARERIERYYSLDVVVKRLMQVYKEVLEDSSN